MTPHFSNNAMDNLAMMRGMDSDTVDSTYADPPVKLQAHLSGYRGQQGGRPSVQGYLVVERRQAGMARRIRE